MNLKTPGVLLGAAVTVALVSCATGPNPAYAPPPIPPGGGAPLVTDAEGAQARALFVNKCTRCHKFYNPANYNDAEWREWFTKMSKKAKLDAGQDELLARYLEVFRTHSTLRTNR